jgi:hypothetical protein
MFLFARARCRFAAFVILFLCMLFFFVDLRVDACSMPGVSQIGVTIEHRSIVDCRAVVVVTCE